MKISIVTPSFNSERFMEATFESIHAQKGDFEIEHWVIDGASTDRTVSILERWSDKLKFISEPDSGQSNAINKGFKLCTGDVLTWINADDVVLPGAFKAVADSFKRRPDMRWLYGRCIIIDEQGSEIRKFITAYKNFLLRSYSYSKLLLENYISQPATYFSRSLWEQCGPIDETLNFAMDFKLWLTFGRIADPLVVDRDLAAFRFYSETKTGGSFEDSLIEANKVSREFSKMAGKPWIGRLNYWLYYKRTAWIYRLLA